MKTISAADFKEALQVLLTETFEGAPAETGSVYLDRRVGIFFTLDDMTAENASKPINETSIASQSEHVRFYLELLNRYILNTADFVDWKNSWRITAVDDDEWKALRKDLRHQYEEVCETIKANDNWSVNIMTVAFAIIAHSAYHLGAIRQLIKQV